MAQGTVILAIGAVVVIDATADIKAGKTPIVGVLGGTALGIALDIIGSATGQWKLVDVFAAAVLAGALFEHYGKGKVSGTVSTLLGSLKNSSSADLSNADMPNANAQDSKFNFFTHKSASVNPAPSKGVIQA